jgi:hypothetical protein
VLFLQLAFKIKTYELAIFHFLAKKGLNGPKNRKNSLGDGIFINFRGGSKMKKTPFFGQFSL